MLINQVDEGAADYGSVGIAGDFGEVFGCREVEADARWDAMRV
jgi:hypothetical protein